MTALAPSPPYLRPHRLDAALRALARGPWQILAGGTDYYPARVGRPLDEPVLDIGALPGLRGVEVDDDGSLRIGTLTTWSDLARGPLPDGWEGLGLAAREVGGAQIQNAGTIGGNLCNASPAADGVPPLLALDAEVELASAAGLRRLPLAQFLAGPRRTVRRADELLSGLVVPPLPAGARGTFLKLGARRYLVISIAMVAVVAVVDEGGALEDVRIAVGACSEVARRLPVLEARLVGLPLRAEIASAVEADDLAPLSPIDDVRATAAFRLDAARTLVGRALASLAVAQG